MTDEIRIWRIANEDKLSELPRSPLNLESRIHSWLEQDISVLAPELLLIGREVATDFGGSVDLLCLDKVGDLVVVELKRDKTPRDIVAQTLDYGSWVEGLSHERVIGIAESFYGQGRFEEEFFGRFGADPPETLNQEHRLLIVASQVDPSSERIIRYLSDSYGVDINAVTFQYFRDDTGGEYLARVFLIEPDQLDVRGSRLGGKRRPNLTYEQLEALAEEQGVVDLYRRVFSGLEQHLQKTTTRSSVGFYGAFEGGRRAVTSLLPQESDPETGLRFRLYFERFRTFVGLSEEQALAALPEERQPWKYYGSADPDMSGYEGFFGNEGEIDRFVAAFGSAPLGKQGEI